MQNARRTLVVSSFVRPLVLAWVALVLSVPGATVAQTLGPPDAAAQLDSRTLRAAGRGNPWMNQEDGAAVPLSVGDGLGNNSRYAWRQIDLDEMGPLEPLTLAAADFDEDGAEDLLSGFGTKQGGLLLLHRGNIDALTPWSAGARERKAAGTFSDAPFSGEGRRLRVDGRPDFLAAGDFDADDHMDVVAAQRGGTELLFLPGDGHGGFGSARPIPLPGTITALVTGEMNRRDGLPELAVAVSDKRGAQVLVYEGPVGALRGEPEAFAVPAPAAALAMGQQDSDFFPDLSVLAGHELLLIHGRDRKLSLDKARRSQVQPAAVSRHKLGFKAIDLALGNFDDPRTVCLALLSADGRVHLIRPPGSRGASQTRAWGVQELASLAADPGARLVRAKVSTRRADDLVVVSPAAGAVHVVFSGANPYPSYADPGTVSLPAAGVPVAVLPMHLNKDALTDLVVLQQGAIPLSVSRTRASMIFTVNSTFDFEGPCQEPPGDCYLRTAIFAANANPGLDEIRFAIPGAGIPVIGVTGAGFGADMPQIVDPVVLDGTTQSAGRVEIVDTKIAVLTRGLELSADNSVLSGLAISNFSGGSILLESANSSFVRNCYLGTNAAGTAAKGTGSGPAIRVVNGFANTIGGLASDQRNVLGGSSSIGIHIETGDDNIVVNNHVGVDIVGTSDLGSSNVGILISTPGNTVGGTTVLHRNVISGNTNSGIEINGNATQTVVQGNFIGLNANGTAKLANGTHGVRVRAPDNTIGGTTAGSRNIISGNGQNGISIEGNTTTGNLVQGNRIGTNPAGTIALGNSTNGVDLVAPDNVVGGTAGVTLGGACTGACNLLSGNVQAGVRMVNSSEPGNTVQGNFIGMLATGLSALPNAFPGVLIFFGKDNLIGGDSAEARNIISGNTLSGVRITGPTSVDNIVAGNYIGLSTVDFMQPNGTNGVEIEGNASNNTIGGGTPEAGNAIQSNQGDGINVASGTGNSLLSNRIAANGSGGIDLGASGSTANDVGDADAGANDLQNFPVLNEASRSVFQTIVRGTLNSTSNTSFVVQLFSSEACDASGKGEGESYLGQVDVRTDGTGNANFVAALQTEPVPEYQVTATATAISTVPRSTSEFSTCRQAKECSVISLTPSSLPLATVGQPYSQTLAASGGGVVYTFEDAADSLPAWLNLAANGTLSGSPPNTNTNTFTIVARDNLGCSGSRTYTLSVNAGGCPAIAINPPSLPTATAGIPYTQTLTASGGTGPHTFTVTSGAAPAGLTLSSGGVLSGTPSNVGQATFTVTSTDANGCKGTRSYTLQVAVDVPMFPDGLGQVVLVAAAALITVWALRRRATGLTEAI